MRGTRILGLLGLTWMLVGCSTTSPFGRERLALPIGPSYVGGRGMQMFPTSPELLTNVKGGMADVGIHSILQNEDPSGLIILEGRTVDDRKARVTVQTSGVNSTVSAKVSWLGDEPLTRAMLDRIGSRQGTIPSQPSNPRDAEEPSEAKPGSPGLFSRDAVPDTTMLRDQIEGGMNAGP